MKIFNGLKTQPLDFMTESKISHSPVTPNGYSPINKVYRKNVSALISEFLKEKK